MIRATVSIGRVAMTGHDDLSAEKLDPSDCGVEVVYLEPEKQAVARRQVVGIANASVVMFLLPAVKLQDQLAAVDEPFVVWSAVVALAVEQLLVPAAACFDISNAN